nr:asparaginase [Actinomycetales bacterium]
MTPSSPPTPSPAPIVAIGALGGTIAMTPAQPGEPVSPGLNAADLVAAVPELAQIAQIRASSIRNVASPAIVVDDVLAALSFAHESAEGGAAGVVLTHGTDTLEETAYLLDLLWGRDEPIILTGALRAPTLPGADGPANVLSAVVTAADPDARGLGVLTVLDDSAHLARLVSKTDASGVWTFQSPGWGPVGRVHEQRLRMMLRPLRRFEPLPVPAVGEIRIPLVESPFDDDAAWVGPLAAGSPRGIVVNGSGVGHLSERTADALEEALAGGTPVVIASRSGSGTTLERTYGYPGAEVDLIRRGFVMGGYLSGRKCRLLLHVLLADGAGPERIREEFAARGF